MDYGPSYQGNRGKGERGGDGFVGFSASYVGSSNNRNKPEHLLDAAKHGCPSVVMDNTLQDLNCISIQAVLGQSVTIYTRVVSGSAMQRYANDHTISSHKLRYQMVVLQEFTNGPQHFVCQPRPPKANGFYRRGHVFVGLQDF